MKNEMRYNQMFMDDMPNKVCTAIHKTVSEMAEDGLTGDHCVEVGITDTGNFLVNCWYETPSGVHEGDPDRNRMSFELEVHPF